MPFELYVALRYLKAKRKGLFAIVTTIIGIAGVTVGVAALVTTLSVMNGFQSDIEKKIIGAQSHIIIYDSEPAQTQPGREGSAPDEPKPELQRLAASVLKEDQVIATSPFLLGQAILTFRGRSTGIALKGLDPKQESRVNDLGKSLVQGTWDFGKDGLVLGSELAKNIGMEIGDRLVLISPRQIATPMGIYPKMQGFRLIGTLRTGYYEFDNTMGYTGIKQAGSFFGAEEAVSGLQVRLRDLSQAERVAKKLQRESGFRYTVRTYSQMNQTLFAALKLEKSVMFIILILIVLVAALNIASNLILMSTEKVRDVGILRALGASPRTISRIFWWEGCLISVWGIGLGLGLGLALSWIIGRYPIVRLPGDIYYLTRVPVSIQTTDILWICAGSFLLCLLATLYPAIRASRTHPVEAIRYG